MLSDILQTKDYLRLGKWISKKPLHTQTPLLKQADLQRTENLFIEQQANLVGNICPYTSQIAMYSVSMGKFEFIFTP